MVGVKKSNRLSYTGALVSDAFLVSPSVFDDDLALAGLRNGWLNGEREVLVAAAALISCVASSMKEASSVNHTV